MKKTEIVFVFEAEKMISASAMKKAMILIHDGLYDELWKKCKLRKMSGRINRIETWRDEWHPRRP